MGSSSLLIALCMTLMLTFMPAQAVWDTAFKEDWNFKCPKNQFLSYMRSVYVAGHRDRVWEFKCQEPSTKVKAKKCSWTGPINELSSDMFAMCPSNKGLAGMKTEFNATVFDRHFRFYCCEIKGKTLHSCLLSNALNNFAAPMIFTATSDAVATGLFARYNSPYKDRAFQVLHCKVPAKKIPKKFFK